MSKELENQGWRPYRFLNEKGEEIPDPTPIEVPIGFKRPESLQEQIRRLIKSEEFAKAVSEQGFETFEESEDFEIEDEMFDPSSPYEEVFDPVLGRAITLDEFHKNHAVYEQRFLEAEQKAYKQMEISEALRARPKKDQESSRAASERANNPDGGKAASNAPKSDV